MFVSTRTYCTGVARPQKWGGQIFWPYASNSILFSTRPLKAQNDKKRKKFGANGPLDYVYARTPTVFSDRESCACFRNEYLFFDLQDIFYDKMALIQ